MLFNYTLPFLSLLQSSFDIFVPNPPTTSNTTEAAMSKFYLFGYPIAHSASPAFHNTCFDMSEGGKQYSLWPTSVVTDEMIETIKAEDFGGCSVTMPLKVAVLPFLHEISHESKITGACNTIVKVKTDGGFKFVGQNTDILGVRNALLRAVRLQYPDLSIHSEASYPKEVKGAGVVIGGGATTRSAAQALSMLGLSPIYLINRDASEIHAVQEALPHLHSTGGLIHLSHPDQVEAQLAQPDSPKVLMIVGAIPAFAPKTKEERSVYTTVSSILTIPYDLPTEKSNDIPVPKTRIFLDMAYKPRQTPMLRVAAAHGWHAIDGVQAMIEQGLAQQRMWKTGIATVEIGSDQSILSPEIEAAARNTAENLKDIHPEGEVDQGLNKLLSTLKL